MICILNTETEPAGPDGVDASPKAPELAREAGSLVPMTGTRKIIADNMMVSQHNSAQLSVFVEISINDIIALAGCRALKDHPVMLLA
jgi:pyruvate/2-oxoglutarate dehydrogenase complex dihydrolipoamide acyltransferase (E2) component